MSLEALCGGFKLICTDLSTRKHVLTDVVSAGGIGYGPQQCRRILAQGPIREHTEQQRAQQQVLQIPYTKDTSKKHRGFYPHDSPPIMSFPTIVEYYFSLLTDSNTRWGFIVS